MGELHLMRQADGVTQNATFDSLDRIFISEVLRDLTLLNPYNIISPP